ncbi:MAG: hypothetical protein GY862_14700, partial [Gammaproteobacteria bacterium]|nr:hypothetical protein [Gammaproteobacteria bacterium]
MLRSVISELLPKSALPHGLIPYKLYRCLGIIALLAGLAGMASPAWGGGPPPVSNPASPFPLSVLDGNNGFIVTGNEADRIGHALGGGGDVNGDGVPDLLIGTLRGGNKSYLIFGGEPLDAWLNETGDSLPVSTLNGENGFVIHGEEDEDESFGMAVSIIGDINGDGIDDLAVGAPYMPVRDGEDYIWNTGKVYVLFGGNTLNDTGGSLDASALNGVNGFILEGMYDEQSVGFALDAAGDVNGDGMDDWIVGAPSRDGYDEHRSKAYVLFGGDTWNLTGGRFTLDDTTLNGVNGAVIHEIYSIGLGASVSGAGDVNNDGKADLIIGVSGWRHWDGRSYVVFGGETLAAAGGSLNASDLDGANGFLFFDSLVDPDDNVGRLGYSVSKAGDVNGDGIGDLLIGAVNGSIPDDDGEFMRTGKAYLLFGGQWLENEASLDMADLDERHAVEFHGWHYDHAGDSVSAAGDINGDGIDDFLVGASVADSNDWEDLGEAYLIYGAPVLDASINLVTLNNNEIDGVRFTEIAHDYEDGSYYNNTVSAAGDLNADGAPDFLIGTPLFNYSDEEGAVYIIFGNASPGQSGFPQVLAAIPANTFNPPGDSVHNLFYERYIDPDQDQFAGIAIVDNAAFPMREGQWEYSVDSGAWTAVGTVSDNAAIVLGPNDRVRFVPIADYFGTPGMLAVRLWDGWGGFSRGSGNNIHGHIGGLNGFSNDKNQVKLKTQITEGSPPQLDIINPLSLTKDASFSYTAGVNDPDTPAADLRFGLDNAPSGAGIGAETGVFTWTPATTGIFSFSVRVTDDTSLSDTTPILINVNAPPRPKPGRIRFLSSSYSVSEQAGYIDISVIRQKYSTGSISVDYDVDAGGGADKDDYLLEAGTLDWASGETGAKTFRITILPDDLPESDETLFLRLHNVRGPGDAILTDHTAVLTIQGDAMNRCTSPIESYCHAGGQTFDGLKISPAGVVAQAILTGSVANEGRITDSTLAAGSRLNGGTLGGIIINHGDLSDFLFIGERLDGGGLSGNIRVAGGETGGILQNIALAGGARISGGRLAGSVTGDPKAPALVTDAAVLAGAQLAHLILGEGVELADGIFFGEGVYPQIGFAAEEYLATENQDHITISVVRTVSTGKSVSAAYRSAEIDDDDAPFVSGVFTWNSDDDNLDKTFSVPAKIDNLPHGMETLTLMLGDIDDAALMPGHSAAILHVRSKLSPETITLLDALGAEFITMEVENPECNLENIAADAEEIQLKLLHVELACDEPNITLFYHKINSMTDSVYRQYGPAARGGMMPEVVFRTVTRDDGRILTTARVTLKDGEASDDTAADWHDVQLAADARINGGILQGAVVGDKDAPALLENVILRTETYLENVIIGDNVKFGPGVTF